MQTVPIRCPHCFELFNLPEQGVGRPTPCERCGRSITPKQFRSQLGARSSSEITADDEALQRKIEENEAAYRSRSGSLAERHPIGRAARAGALAFTWVVGYPEAKASEQSHVAALKMFRAIFALGIVILVLLVAFGLIWMPDQAGAFVLSAVLSFALISCAGTIQYLRMTRGWSHLRAIWKTLLGLAVAALAAAATIGVYALVRAAVSSL